MAALSSDTTTGDATVTLSSGGHDSPGDDTVNGGGGGGPSANDLVTGEGGDDGSTHQSEVPFATETLPSNSPSPMQAEGSSGGVHAVETLIPVLCVEAQVSNDTPDPDIIFKVPDIEPRSSTPVQDPNDTTLKQ